MPPSQVALSARGDEVVAAWDDRPAQGTRRLALARIGADGEMVRMQGGEGRIPALETRGGAALVAWHDRQAVRAAWIGGR
ncbi:MAG TPA: hypothetical protein VEQ60_16295 [Longimicrobium sp.]|nr:hypothetical protein [Longimicrobium sp.]